MHNNPSASSSAAEHASTRSFGTTSPKNVTAGLMRPVPQTPQGAMEPYQLAIQLVVAVVALHTVVETPWI